MDIKNLNIFRKPSAKMRLCALSLALVMTTSTLASCSSKNSFTDISNGSQYEQSYNEETKKVFETGEHIISVPIKDPTKDVMQHNYYEGYKCIGMATSSYGGYIYGFGGACVLYVNEVPVECYASAKDKVYSNFGTPLEFEKTENNTTAETKDFGVGEHIISVPIKDPTKDVMQHNYYEGYECIGMATSSYGGYIYGFGGACIMYVNTEPVRCKVSYYDNNNNGYYTTFGTPIILEDVMTKTLKYKKPCKP